MRLASKDGVSARERLEFALLRLGKRVRQRLRYRPDTPKTILFVVGCQRSGTTMFHHLLRLDRDSVTYDEYSPLSAGEGDEALRWRDLAAIESRLRRERAPLVVVKPLVESQNLPDLLDRFAPAQAVWLYRDFRDVASSSLKFFTADTGRTDLAPILAADQEDWRAEHVAPETLAEVRALAAEASTPHDHAALFWYARNALFFSRHLDRDPRVALCRYDDLVAAPEPVMRACYGFVGRPFPGPRIVKDVFAHSRGLGREVPLSPPVVAACERMAACLDAQPRLGVPTSESGTTGSGG